MPFLLSSNSGLFRASCVFPHCQRCNTFPCGVRTRNLPRIVRLLCPLELRGCAAVCPACQASLTSALPPCAFFGLSACVGHGLRWRGVRDSNPRGVSALRFSKPLHSAALPTPHVARSFPGVSRFVSTGICGTFPVGTSENFPCFRVDTKLLAHGEYFIIERGYGCGQPVYV